MGFIPGNNPKYINYSLVWRWKQHYNALQRIGMFPRFVITLSVVLAVLTAGDKKTEHAWREATVVAVENNFIQTGTAESGNLDNGQNSGRFEGMC
jgi:hypothetical protein